MDFSQYTSTALIATGFATAAAVSASLYLTMKSKPLIPIIDLDNQSDVLEDGSRRHRNCSDGKLMEYLFEDARTCPEAFLRGLRVSNNGRCLGARTGPNLEYEWLTYQEVYDEAQSLGSGLLQEGLQAKNDTFIGIYSKNRPEFTISDIACVMYSMVPVPLYDTLGSDSRCYIINQTELTHIICDNSQKVQRLLTERVKTPKLKCLIVMDNFTAEQKEEADKLGIKLISFNSLQKIGQKNIKEPVFPKPSDLAVICYTSGTTGVPKGSMLTHGNLISNASAVIFHGDTGVNSPDDIHMSYLPLAHMFERTSQLLQLMQGVQIGFFQGDPLLLFDDIQALKPTTIPLVPRILNRMYDKVLVSVSTSRIKTYLFNKAMQSKSEEIKQCIIRKNSIWDYLVFRKIQNVFGGRVKVIICGSAPLDQKVVDFARCAFGCFFREGYGQTEASAGVSLNIVGDFTTGHVGSPLSCNLVKLTDVPDMNYFAADCRGEVCVKGPNVFKGYYNSPEKTAEVLDKDGWLHTGDIGEWLPSGTLKIIDRKKHIFKLSQGEYIAPEKIESIYARSKFVGQCFVDGWSMKDFLVAIVVPDEDVVSVWAKEQKIDTDMGQLIKSKVLKKTILKDIHEVGRSNGLNSLELVKNIYLHRAAFSIENDLLTPTLKSKRNNLRDFFEQQIHDMYEKYEPELTSDLTKNTASISNWS